VSPPENGLINSNKQFKKHGYPVNTTLEFSCLPGFKLYGSRPHTCVTDGYRGEWIGDRVQCRPEETSTHVVSPTTVSMKASDVNEASIVHDEDILFKPYEKIEINKSIKSEDESAEIVYEECKIDQSSMLISYSDIII
jgi:hypothetical protein